ncbi:MAG: hypothetical protein HZA93_08870 [Verrucomicrobia bacterium]|nr:hypothetical protein [Verrucomicrobiota bacterium]
MKTSQLHPRRLAVAIALGWVGASGQTAGPAPAAAAGPSRESPVELSPFIVSSEQDQGYQAANTLAGSRLNTALKDTPAALSILTEEFIKDVGALNLTQAIAFGNNVELELPDGNAAFEFFNTFLIRGQAASVARNYFLWRLPTNTFNVERIEEARGPNSILFGIASAGGLLNVSTKQALTHRNFRKAQLVYGIYDLRRASFDLNQTSFNGRLGVRVNGVADRSQAYQHYVFNEDTRGHVAVKYNFRPETVVRAEYEKGRTFRNTADNQEIGDNLLQWYNNGRTVQRVTATNNALGITLNSATSGNLSVNLVDDGRGGVINFDARGLGVTQGLSSAGLVTDPALVDSVNYRVSLGGASQTQRSNFDTYSVSLDQKFGKNINVQLALNHQEYVFEAWQASAPTGLKGDPNQFLRDGTANPNAGRLYFETYWTQRHRREKSDNYRLTASHELNLGKWGEYRAAGLANREVRNLYQEGDNEAWIAEATNGGAYNASPSAGANRVLRRHYITVGDQATYYASPQHPTGASGFIKGMVDPSNPTRTLKTRMTPSSGSLLDDPTEQDSYLLAAQAYYFKRRLVLAGGYRTDTLYLHEGRRSVTNTTGDFIIDNVNNPRTNRTLDAKTKTLGTVVHVLPWLSLRYNRSNSVELANTGVRLMPNLDAAGLPIGNTSRVGDNPKGEGKDYGFDLNLLDGRLHVRATRFSTTRAGAQGFTYGGTVDNPTVLSNRVLDQLQTNGLITTAVREAHRINSGGSTFSVASTGYEVSVTANLTKQWRLQGNYSTSDPVSSDIAPEIQEWAAKEIPFFQKFDQNLIITSVNTTLAAEIARWRASNQTNLSVAGVGTIGTRKEKASVVSRYSFGEGALKGFYVGATARHQSKMVIGYSATRKQVIYGNSFTRADAFLGYNFGRSERLKFLKNASVQLNVTNVLDQHDPLITRPVNADAAIVAYNRMAPQLPLAWQLTADLSF